MTILIATLTLIGCQEQTNKSNPVIEKNVPTSTETATFERTLDDVINYFGHMGFEIGEQSNKVAELLGAAEGVGVKLNGQEVELYLYDEESVDLEEIHTSGSYALNGVESPAIVNGKIVLVRYEDHPYKEAILEAFTKYQ